MGVKRDPRWKKIHEARIGAYDRSTEEVEMGWTFMAVEFYLAVVYKDVLVYHRFLMDEEEYKALNNEMFGFIWDMIVDRIDEGLDRVDAGETMF